MDTSQDTFDTFVFYGTLVLWKSKPDDLVACINLFGFSHLKCMPLSGSHSMLGEFWSPSVLLHFNEVFKTFIKLPPQHINQAEAWAIATSWLHSVFIHCVVYLLFFGSSHDPNNRVWDVAKCYLQSQKTWSQSGLRLDIFPDGTNKHAFDLSHLLPVAAKAVLYDHRFCSDVVVFRAGW